MTLTEDEAIKTFCQDIISAATSEVTLEERLKLEPVDHVHAETTKGHDIGKTSHERQIKTRFLCMMPNCCELEGS